MTRPDVRLPELTRRNPVAKHQRKGNREKNKLMIGREGNRCGSRTQKFQLRQIRYGPLIRVKKAVSDGRGASEDVTHPTLHALRPSKQKTNSGR